MANKAVWISEKPSLRYHFHDQHPFNQQRIVATRHLLESCSALDEKQMYEAAHATDEQLYAVHDRQYVSIVKQLSEHPVDGNALRLAPSVGLGAGDTPYFRSMHEITAHVVGGTIEAAHLVMSGQLQHALHLGGGLHHAMPDRGAGFCVYNDAAVAAAYIRKQFGARVLYIDTDVHHGDGVQTCFYEDPHVFTWSIHESGEYLFPGTGSVYERGKNEGFGSCLNMPLEPQTDDDSWLRCFNELLERIIEHFRPDVIISQHGCDAHYYDPLAHLSLSMETYRQIPKRIHEAAHKYCEGRWIALGGGGYDHWRVVPRAWALIWLEMTDHPLIKQIEKEGNVALPSQWINRWSHDSPHPLPTHWLDDVDSWEKLSPEKREQIHARNDANLAIAISYVAR